MFADDLILMGQANVEEANAFLQTLQIFSRASGQRLGPEKSKIWFSKVTPQVLQQQIMQFFNAPRAARNEVYLGVPLLANKQEYFSLLLDRIYVRLNGWKAGLLSQTSKVVLIKALIESLLVYTMSSTFLPKGLIKQITKLIRGFFWNKNGSGRYLALVGWDKITLPKFKGGLGIIDLDCLNEALILKIVWKLAQQSDYLWAQVLTAKYLSRGTLWFNNRVSNCTPLWKAIKRLKTIMEPHMCTVLGDLTSPAFSNPWHEFWLQIHPRNSIQKRLCIKDLVNHETGEWNSQKLISVFGFYTALYIAVKFPRPPSHRDVPDRLIFTRASHGCYTVKTGYHIVRDQKQRDTGNNSLALFWKTLWRQTEVIPRIQVFLWRIAQGELPVGDTWARMWFAIRYSHACLILL
jgi:hypothetical protein